MSTQNNRSNPVAKAIKLALLTTASAFVFTPHAVLAASSDGDDADEEERIVVTGSRIRRTDIETASPVFVTSSEDIKLSGYNRIEDMMNSLPQVEASNNAFQANGATGTASVDLRGLGAVRTLVLVNGRRLQAGNLNSAAPDLNQIPTALVDRVEILTGGGSSTYGSDAVAGVVNFILKDDFEGLEVVLGGSGFQHNNDNKYIQDLMTQKGFDFPTGSSGIDGKTSNIDITLGSTFNGGKGHATAYMTYRSVDELRQGARDYSACALNNAGTSCGGSLNTEIPSFFIGDVDPVTGAQVNYALWSLDRSGNGFQIPQDGTRYNYAPPNHFQRPDTRYTAGTFVNYEINEHAKPYLEFMHTEDRTVAQIAESGTFFAEQYNISIDSDIISPLQRQQILAAFPNVQPGGDFSVYIGKRNTEGGPRQSRIQTNANRFVFGIAGDINDNWSYDSSFQYSTTASSVGYLNDFFAPRIKTAVDADSTLCADTAGCVRYDVFTLNGVTAAQAATLTGVGVRTGFIRQTIANAYVTGEIEPIFDTAEDSIGLVFGVEYRKDNFSSLSDEVFEKGLLLGQGGPTASVSGTYDITDYYTEASIPLIQGKEGVENLVLDLGYRYSDYQLTSGKSTYKIGLDYMPVDGWKLRGSFNRAVRSPNVTELFPPQSLGLWNGTDPCGGATPILTAAQCANTGVSAAEYGNIVLSPASQYNGVFGGNPSLKPETADTLTFGVVANPLENFNFSVDFWDVKIDDVIGNINAELIVTQCGLTGNASFCDLIHRGNGGTLWRGQAGFVTATNVNLGSQHWQGYDFTSNYNLELDSGMLQVQFVGTLLRKKITEPLPGDTASVFDCTGITSTQCFASPKWRHTLKAAWTPAEGDWSVNAKWRFFGDVKYNDTVDTLAANGLGTQSYIDLNVAYEITENIGFLLGVNNVFDKEPPLVGGTLSTNANTVAGFYDPLGRFIHGSVTFRF